MLLPLRVHSMRNSCHMVHVTPAVWVGIVTALAAGLAWLTREPFIFPSLGATADLCATAPNSPAARPRAVFVSHSVAAVVGFLVLHGAGLGNHAPVAVEGMSMARIGALSLALALTVGATSGLKALHPPAGATALIVTLGILSTPHELAILMASVVLFSAGLVLLRRFVVADSAVPTVVRR